MAEWQKIALKTTDVRTGARMYKEYKGVRYELNLSMCLVFATLRVADFALLRIVRK